MIFIVDTIQVVHEMLLESFGVKIKNALKLGKRVKQGIFED
jgi:hypothetical protein